MSALAEAETDVTSHINERSEAAHSKEYIIGSLKRLTIPEDRRTKDRVGDRDPDGD